MESAGVGAPQILLEEVVLILISQRPSPFTFTLPQTPRKGKEADHETRQEAHPQAEDPARASGPRPGYSQIEVVIQPQSIIHSMVQYVDGAIIAQLGTPDMRVPIEYALFYPERRSLSGDRLDFSKLSQITFEKPDYKVFRGLSLAIEAGKTGGTMPTVFNAANERAVAKFLKGEIKYTDIVRSIEKCMDAHKVSAHPDLEEILATEQWVYSILQ